MPLFFKDKPGAGIDEDAPPLKGARRFFQILQLDFFDLVKLNLIFYLFCIPIITIPASYCAMTRVVVNMVRDRPCFLWHEFWKTFRSEFKRATLAGILLIAGLAASAAAIVYYANLISSDGIYWALAAFPVIGATLLFFMSFSLFPMIALIDLPLKELVKNAWLLISVSVFRYILASLVCIFFMVIGFLLFPLSFVPALLIYPSLFTLVTVFSAYAGIGKYVLRVPLMRE